MLGDSESFDFQAAGKAMLVSNRQAMRLKRSDKALIAEDRLAGHAGCHGAGVPDQ